jgi:hypothetical protein
MTPSATSYGWLVLPGARITINQWAEETTHKNTIVISGNREGLVSLGNMLLAISLTSGDHESLSITGLPFAYVEGSLSLTVVQPFTVNELEGMVVRTDKHNQYQWQLSNELLEKEATCILGVGYIDDGYVPDHYHAVLSQNTTVGIIFERNS